MKKEEFFFPNVVVPFGPSHNENPIVHIIRGKNKDKAREATVGPDKDQASWTLQFSRARQEGSVVSNCEAAFCH